jgi:type II secretory pathway component PulK
MSVTARSRMRQRAFALVLVLVLLLLAAAGLAGAARHSALAAVASEQGLQRMQWHWALISCRAALPGRIPALLDRAEGRDPRNRAGIRTSKDKPREPVRAMRVRCVLAGRTYDLVLTDEQAKVSVNRLLLDASVPEATAIVRRLTRGPGRGRDEVRLRPLAGGATGRATSALRAAGAYGQVFDAAPPQRLAGTGRESGLAANVTCWSSGMVNFSRAPRAVLEEVFDMTAGRRYAQSFIEARDRVPYSTLKQVLALCERIDDVGREAIEGYLTDESSCFGLWVIAYTSGERRYAFTAVRTGDMQPDGWCPVNERYDYQW